MAMKNPWEEQERRFGGLGVGTMMGGGQPQVQAQPQSSGGFAGMLKGIVRSIASPINYAYQGVFENPIKELAAEFTHNKVARDNARKETKRELGGSDDATASDAFKKWAGNSAQLLTLPLAPGASTIGKSTAIGAIGGGGSALAQEDSTLDDVIGGTLLGGVTAGSLTGAGKILGKVGGRGVPNRGVGSKLENAGNRLLGTQANLTRAETRNLGRGLNPATVLGDINKRTGLTSMESMSNVGRNITGDEGVFNELRKNAIGNTQGVDIGDLRNIADDLLLDKAPLITGAKRTSVLDSVKNNVVKSYGGSKGSLNPIADPFDAFDAASKFDSMAADLRKGANVSAADRQLASVYKGLSKTINNRLFASDGVAEGLKLAKPQAKEALLSLAKTAPRKEAAAYTKLAKELDLISDVPGLRNAQSSFVNLSKIDEATANARSGAGAALGGQMQGAGKLLQRPTNIVAMPLDAATPAIGGLLAKSGRALQGGVPQMRGGEALRGLARQGTAITVADRFNQPEAPITEPELPYDTTDPGFQYLQQADMVSPEQQSKYPREAAALDIQKDLQATGGKNMDKIMALWEFMNPEPAPPELSAVQQQRATAAENALRDMGQIEDAISSGKLGGFKSLPGAGTALGRRLLGTEDLDAALFNVADNILRARSGAATPEAEVKRFASSFLPNPTDSSEAKLSKLQRAQRELQGYVNPMGATY